MFPAAMAHLLHHPEGEISLSMLPFLWTTTRLTYVYRRPPDVDTGHRLPAAVRGALGRQLFRLSQTAQTEQEITAYPGLFVDCPGLFDKNHFPKPFVIWCTTRHERICVEISLFGEAGMWREVVHAAMLGVMKPADAGGESGITIDESTKQHRIWDLETSFWRVRGFYPVPPAKRSFLLSMMTPLVLANNRTLKGDYARAFSAMLIRLQGLAAWHGLRVAELGDVDKIRKLSSEIVVETHAEPRIATFSRRSKNFGSMVRHEDGLMTSLHIKDYPDEIWPAFVLGTLCHLGYSVSQGAGRYVISDP